MKIDKYLRAMLDQDASDLHFVSGDPVRARVHGGLQVIMDEVLTTEFVGEAVAEIMDSASKLVTRRAHEDCVSLEVPLYLEAFLLFF